MWIGFNPEFPVIVAGVQDGKITPDGLGAMEFENFAAAKAVFPDLDPAVNGQRFTWAMSGGIGKTRFETWEANAFYSR